MSLKLIEFLPDFMDSLARVIQDHDYLLKGGQAIRQQVTKYASPEDARYSRDVDISFSSESFPFPPEELKSALIADYNSRSDNNILIKPKTCVLQKLPQDEKVYFGMRLRFNVGKKRLDGKAGNKQYFTDIDSFTVIVDFTVHEIVEQSAIEILDGRTRTATPPLIVAEKYRALCSLIDPQQTTGQLDPRPKDFFDIFLIYNVIYDRDPKEAILRKVSALLNKVFAIKRMNLDLLERLYDPDQKTFHRQAYEEQVTQTLSPNSKYKDVTFDQIYSESLEFLDRLKPFL